MYKRDYAFRMNVMEEIFEIRSCVEIMANHINWTGLSSVLHPRQHSIFYMGDGFYRSKDPTNSIKQSINQTYNNQTINIKHNKSPSLH